MVRTRRFERTFAGAVILAMLAGCGSEAPSQPVAPQVVTPVAAAPVAPAPTATPKPATHAKTTKTVTPTKTTTTTVTTPSATVTKAPTPKATATPTATPSVTLADLMAAHNELNLTQTTNSVTDNKKDGSKQVTTKTTTRFKTPGTYAIEVTDSSNGKTGTRVVFNYGATDARVKGGGILGIATLTLKLTDSLLLGTNGWRLDQVVVKGILDRLTSGGYTSETAGTSTVGGTPITVLKVTTSGQNTLDPDIAYELVGFDAAKQVRLWGVYGKSSLGLPQDLIYQLVLDTVDLNPTLPANTFTL